MLTSKFMYFNVFNSLYFQSKAQANKFNFKENTKPESQLNLQCPRLK